MPVTRRSRISRSRKSTRRRTLRKSRSRSIKSLRGGVRKRRSRRLRQRGGEGVCCSTNFKLMSRDWQPTGYSTKPCDFFEKQGKGYKWCKSGDCAKCDENESEPSKIGFGKHNEYMAEDAAAAAAE